MSETKQVEKHFDKEQLMKSKKYHEHADALNVVLVASETYTQKQVDDAIAKFYKGGK